MTGRARGWFASIAAWTVALVSLAAQAPAPPPGQQATRAVPRASVAAYLVVDLQTGRRLAVRRENLIGQPVAPGSIAKIATLIAALESHVVEPDTTTWRAEIPA